jgi:GDP-mannose 6-dehydrogenase
VCNCFHGLKVGFSNEVGQLCKAQGIDSHEVMRLVCEDRKLNISAAYLRPGFAFGGSCLPKDIRAIVYRAQQLDVEVPILRATLESNRKQIERAFQMVLAAGHRRVGILGLSFKAGTDDLRESPMVTLIELLIGRGMELTVFDRHVSESQTMGANKEYVEREVPHIWTLMRPRIEEVIEAGETIVVGNASPEWAGIRERLRPGQILIDLARAFGAAVSNGVDYEGIAW